MNTSGIVRLRASRDKLEAENEKLRAQVAELQRDVSKLQERSIAQTNSRMRLYWLGYDHGKANQPPKPPKEENNG